MMIAAKYAIELSREREREQVLQALVESLPPRFRPPPEYAPRSVREAPRRAMGVPKY